MQPTDYVICAAGEGKRFENWELGKKKPLIRLQGRTLLERSIDSLNLFKGDRLIFIVQRRHGICAALSETMAQRFPFHEILWMELDAPTGGQLETALVAKDHYGDRSVALFNADTYFSSKSLVALQSDPGVAGIIPCSQQPGNEWSFCHLDAAGKVDRVTEKERISDYCSVGYYYFRSGREFVGLAEEEIASLRGTGRETYIAPVYNRFLAKGARVEMDLVDEFRPMGTPEQIERFWNVTSEQVRAENFRGVIVVDLDATLTWDDAGVSYAEKRPNRALIERLKDYDRKGFRIVIHTARRMRTFGGNEALVIGETGETTLEWLKRHEVPYSGIKFGRPYADGGFYVCDRTIRPAEFLRFSAEEIEELLKKDQSLLSAE